jgi:hypothetical protein
MKRESEQPRRLATGAAKSERAKDIVLGNRQWSREKTSNGGDEDPSC